MLSPDRHDPVFFACERFLNGHGPRLMGRALGVLLDEVAEGERADLYGRGGPIESFEQELAALFGKPSALFMPSGTMAQQIALRIACDRRSLSTVAFHATSHLELHEERAYEHVHHLRARLLGSPQRPLTFGDLEALDEPVGALLLELPQRELGGTLPAWSEVQAIAAWAQARGTALHLDGARLWETQPYYGLTYAELAAPFDTLYVSFYKTLGGIAGAALLGDEESIKQARVWLRRMGGNLISLYPYVLSARVGMRERLPRIPSYCARARQVAALFAAIEGVEVMPNPPPTNLMHLSFPVTAERLLDASAEIARRERIALVQRARPGVAPGTCMAELTVGDGALTLSDEELRPLLSEMVSLAR